MGDPELRNDEKVLLRTPGVYVKSIPFEGILTNKRIILIDRAKNLLPPKEIPLVTIKEVEPGENAIRDQIITLSVMAKTGETRQMILTFSRQAGGNRIKERDAWVRIIKENASSSFDQVIRKVIPKQEPAPSRTEPAVDPRFDIVHAPFQSGIPSTEHPPVEAATGDIRPVPRSVPTSPVPTVPATPVVREVNEPFPPANAFCLKCGNKVPAESVFCNRCGSPIAQISPVSAPVQIPPAPPLIRTPGVRPLDEEIQSIEPLIEPSSVVIPADALRTAPVGSVMKKSLSWDNEGKPEPAFKPEAKIAGEQAAENGFLPPVLSEKTTASSPAPVPLYEGTGDTQPPPKPPRNRSIIPDKQRVLSAAVVLVVILLVAAGALFVYPMLTGGGPATPSGSGDVTPTPATSTLKPSGTIVIKETQAPQIPTTGVYVHINYLGGFKGSYGIPDMITTVPGNSGDRVWEVENATNNTVQATFEKLDGSSHELLVEIYKDGKVLTSGTTTVGHGSVALSVDMVTGKAATPVTSGRSSTVLPGTATPRITVAAVKTTAQPASTTTVPMKTATTTVAANTTTPTS